MVAHRQQVTRGPSSAFHWHPQQSSKGSHGQAGAVENDWIETEIDTSEAAYAHLPDSVVHSVSAEQAAIVVPKQEEVGRFRIAASESVLLLALVISWVE